MKKFFFIGLLVFVVFFTAATIIWFSYDKNKYGTKQYDKTFKDDAFDNVSINLDSTELRIKRGNQFRVKYDGDIEFKNMPSKVDAKASTKQGDIRFKYDSKPEDTILKLNPGTGDSVVKNKTFTNGKVGKSDNVLEFYTIDGNIKVE